MPKTSPHPHVSWREGRPRFQPGPELRAAGLKGTDLRWPDPAPAAWAVTALAPGAVNTGRWFTRGEAVDWSDAFRQSMRAAKVPATPRPAQRRQAAAAVARSAAESFYTVEHLFEDWQRSAKFQRPADPAEAQRLTAEKVIYAENSIVDFRRKARIIQEHDPDLWASPAAALTTPICFGLYEDILATRGVSMARGALATLSMALGWGKKRGKVKFRLNDGANPAHGLGMATPPPRIRFATRLEIETLVSVADALGRPDVGDMVLLGVWTGQRQGDRLALEDRGLVKGRRIFRQAKTNATVAIREVPNLARRLAASAERRRAAKAEALLGASPEEREQIEERFRRVILNERVDQRFEKCLWQPFNGQTYAHLFADIRDVAVKGMRTDDGSGWQIKPCPSLSDFTDPDLRDTAVTWMALAGATVPEICSVTGHSLQSATRILKHYLALHPEMADEAMRKMDEWYEAEGETEIGL